MSDSVQHQELRQQAQYVMQRGDFAGAIPLLAPLVSAEPADFHAARLLGMAYSETGQHAAALPLLYHAAVGDPGSAEGHFFYGVALARASRPVEAATSLEHALSLDPSLSTARVWLDRLRGASSPMHPGAAPPPAYPPAPGTRPGFHGRPSRFGSVFSSFLKVRLILGLVGVWGIALLGCLALLFAGRSTEADAREFPQPKKLTFAQFVKARPERGYFHVTGCRIDADTLQWTEHRKNGRLQYVSDILVHVYDSRRDDPPKAVDLVLAVDDPVVREFVQKMAEEGAPRSPADENIVEPSDQLLEKYADELFAERELVGFVHGGPSSDPVHSGVSNYGKKVAAGCVILDQGYQPDAAHGRFMVQAGTVGLAVLLALTGAAVWWLLACWRRA
ncbi:MAG: tetratricopeptide repeat protein [Armatimonadota bacterium]